MKGKSYLTMAVFAIVGGGFLSCSSEGDRAISQPENPKFEEFIQAAEIHSMALEQYFQEEMAGKQAEFTRSLNDGSAEQNLESSVARILGDIVRNDSRLEELDAKYAISASATRSEEQSVDHLIPFIEDSFSLFKTVSDIESLKNIMNQRLCCQEYKQFSQQDQDHIMFSFAIFVDSMTYWMENMDKWFAITNPDTRAFMSPWERDMYRNAHPLATEDAIGSVMGGVTGAIGGFWMLGWGGAVGLATGWLWGGVTASISATW